MILIYAFLGDGFSTGKLASWRELLANLVLFLFFSVIISQPPKERMKEKFVYPNYLLMLLELQSFWEGDLALLYIICILLSEFPMFLWEGRF